MPSFLDPAWSRDPRSRRRPRRRPDAVNGPAFQLVGSLLGAIVGAVLWLLLSIPQDMINVICSVLVGIGAGLGAGVERSRLGGASRSGAGTVATVVVTAVVGLLAQAVITRHYLSWATDNLGGAAGEPELGWRGRCAAPRPRPRGPLGMAGRRTGATSTGRCRWCSPAPLPGTPRGRARCTSHRRRLPWNGPQPIPRPTVGRSGRSPRRRGTTSRCGAVRPRRSGVPGTR